MAERGLAGMLAGRRERGIKVADELAEFYDSENLPGDALGREARKLHQRGSLYLGGGVGAAKKSADNTDTFTVTKDDKEVDSHDTALTATAAAYKMAGAMAHPDTPGGSAKITEPAVAARVRELDSLISEEQDRLDRYTAESKVKVQPSIVPGASNDDNYRLRYAAECRMKLRRYRAERKALLGRDGAVQEATTAFDPSKHPRGTGSQGGQFTTVGGSGSTAATGGAKGNGRKLVLAVQRELGIKTTGTYDAATSAAVTAFQKSHGLTVDGVVGTQTTAALRSPSSGKSTTPGSLTQTDRSYLRSRSRARSSTTRTSPLTSRRRR